MDYLNDGTGNPCAGQLIENIRSTLILNVPRVSEDVGNIGLADPIGSKTLVGQVNFNTRIAAWIHSFAGQGKQQQG